MNSILRSQLQNIKIYIDTQQPTPRVSLQYGESFYFHQKRLNGCRLYLNLEGGNRAAKAAIGVGLLVKSHFVLSHLIFLSCECFAGHHKNKQLT